MSLITPQFGIIFWQTVTFLSVLWILSKFAWKPILGVLKERERTVSDAVEQISRAEQIMDQAKNEQEHLLKEANLERMRIIDTALETKREIMEQAHQEAVELKEHFLMQANLEIAREQARALEIVKRNVGRLAVEMAEKLLVKELDQETAQWALMERVSHKNASTLSVQNHIHNV